MTYRTLLVHVDNSQQSRARVELAVDFACRLPAHLTGIYLPFHMPLFSDVTDIGGMGVPPPSSPESDARRLEQAEQMFVHRPAAILANGEPGRLTAPRSTIRHAPATGSGFVRRFVHRVLGNG